MKSNVPPFQYRVVVEWPDHYARDVLIINETTLERAELTLANFDHTPNLYINPRIERRGFTPWEAI